MNHYRTSKGEKLTKSVIDRRIREAKQKKLFDFLEDNGYYYCEECKSSNKYPIDCSHDISVDQCQKTGRSELAYDVKNITLRCRECHIKHD